MARDTPLYEMTPVTATTRMRYVTQINMKMGLTIDLSLVECKMALSTISGPQTNVAPCFRADNRVGTKMLDIRQCDIAHKDCIVLRTGSRANHRRQEYSVLEII
jgi:hypothetical protein